MGLNWDSELEESASKPGMKTEGSEKEELKLDPETKQRVVDAIKTLEDIAEGAGVEIDEVFEYGKEMEGEEGDSKLGEDSESEMSDKDSPDSSKKMALYIAQLKAKRA